MSHIVTIGREFGSGGREFGRRLAEALGYEYFDQEILTAIVEKTSFSESYVREMVEHASHTLFPITIGVSFGHANLPYGNLEQLQELYRAQSSAIKELSQNQNCVIVGRCADYILEEEKPFKIFLYATLESKMERCRARSKTPLSDKELRREIQKIDKSRARYYLDYTGKTWGDPLNYDLLINTTGCNIKELIPYYAHLIQYYFEDHQ